MARRRLDKVPSPRRRHLLAALAAAGLAGPLLPALVRADEPIRLRKPIPSSGETLPVIGLGTSRVFDVDEGSEAVGPLGEVLELLAAVQNSLVDSSPMYGNAERVIGNLIKVLGARRRLFVATKVWTEGERAGINQMKTSMSRLHAEPIDLMQVHNLLDWPTQLRTLRRWKEDGSVRYVGITHYEQGAYEQLEDLMRREPLDFVQLNYSLAERTAEERLLPLAADRGIAIIANRPFARGALFQRVSDRPLPPWAADIDCRSWAQFFLKFIVSHPAVTVAIPATSKPAHMKDNLEAGVGRLPTEAQRRRMVDYFLAL